MSHSSENFTTKWQLSYHLDLFTYQHQASQQASQSEVACSAFLRSHKITSTFADNFIPFQNAYKVITLSEYQFGKNMFNLL